MLTLRPPHPALVAAAGVAAALAVAAPAGATEGPAAPPPAPWNVTAPSFAPGVLAPGITAPSKSAVHRRPAIRGARVVPRRIHKGKRATLRLSLPQAGKVRYTLTRVSAPHRGRKITGIVSVKAGKISIRLPRGANGRALAPGRYRVTVVAVDEQGSRSRSVARSLIVRPSHR
jgi:hypothetical protein